MTSAADIVGIVIGIIGVLSVIVGVLTYLDGVRKSRSENDIGFICCNKRRMGIFMATTLWYSFLPWAEARILSVPTITGFLRAGDANKWTSALLDDLSDNLDDEVCWKQIYENFFIQLAWDEDLAPKDARIATKNVPKTASCSPRRTPRFSASRLT